jgi:hypothetical protein
MARTVTASTTPATRAARRARGHFPARTLHLVDIENLVGTGLPAEWEVADVRQEYAVRVGVGPMDQVVIGCNHKALPAAGHGWPGARYLVRSGPDGADTELLAVIECENVAARFSRVVIASGDGGFTWAAAGLAAAGCQVTVVSRRTRLARTLRLGAQHVIYLDSPATAPAAPRPDAA